MRDLHQLLLLVHVPAATVGLALFWVAALTRKGGGVHRRAGRVFAGSAHVMGLTALGIAGLDVIAPARAHPDAENPVAVRQVGLVLATLGWVTLAAVRHGLLAVEEGRGAPPRRRGAAVARTVSAAALATSLATIVVGLWERSPLLVTLPTIAAALAMSQLRDAGRGEVATWKRRHLRGFLAAGTAYHTALLALGSERIVGVTLGGAWSLAPWLLPSAVGGAAILWASRRHAPPDRAPVTPP